jgi:hypothetical protein
MSSAKIRFNHEEACGLSTRIEWAAWTGRVLESGSKKLAAYRTSSEI